MQLFRKKRQKNDLFITYLSQHISFQLRTISPAPGEEKRRGGRVFSSSPWWSVTCWLLGDWPSKPWILGSESWSERFFLDIFWPKKRCRFWGRFFRDFFLFWGEQLTILKDFSRNWFLKFWGSNWRKQLIGTGDSNFSETKPQNERRLFRLTLWSRWVSLFVPFLVRYMWVFFWRVFYFSNLVRYVYWSKIPSKKYPPTILFGRYIILYWTLSVPWF